MITDIRNFYKPFEYDKAFEYYKDQHRSHWLADEVPLSSDISDWKGKLSESEKNVIGNILKSFAQTEVHVNDYWSTKVSIWFPKPEIQAMARAFADFESIHAEAYARLNDELGLTDFQAFLEDEASKNKIERLLEVKDGSIKEIAISLAIFSAFTEGVSLFSSFAILMSFQLRNLLKGTGQIVEWSIRDECHVEGTEVLTNKGWVNFKDLNIETDLICQYTNNGNVEFVKASRKVQHTIDEEIVNFKNKKNSFKVTKNHELLYTNDRKTIKKEKASTINYYGYVYTPVTANISSTKSTKLTDFQRFCIAVQADGHVTKQGNGDVRGKKGGFNVKFNLTKDRKIERLKGILNNLGYEYKIKNKDLKSIIIDVKSPVFEYKDLNWVYNVDLDLSWCEDFINEVIQWDGHIRSDSSDSYLYCSTNKSCIDVVSYIGVLAGYRTNVNTTVDNRKETYKDHYRLSLYDKDVNFVSSTSLKNARTFEHYKGDVFCVTVPSGMIITRYEGCVLIGGNCLHSNAGCWLFRTLINEYEINLNDLIDDIYEACETSIKLEFDFIDKVFEMGDIENLTKDQMKNFIKARANEKLIELGFQPLYNDIDPNLLKMMEWFGHLSSGKTQQDFFAGRVTAYSKSTSDWSDL